MATTTPNFGWSVPTSTDLVKDGATAIETLGDAIDASLVDLKGGTTGQVLAKNSNTDMDFTWSNVDPLTILDAKGDLITATAADTPARLASSGVNGEVLTVDTTTATGLKWSAPATTGITWTQRQQGSVGSLYSIAYNGSNLYVAAGGTGKLYTSPDGITWTSRTSGFGTQLIRKVHYANSLWVAVGGNGLISTSSDGITWTARTANMSTNTIVDVIFANSLWVAVGHGGGGTNTGGITYSSDGITWTRKSQSLSVGTIYSGVIYNGTNWIVGASASTNNYLYASTPSGTWTAAQWGGGASSDNIDGLFFDGTRTIAIGQYYYWYSTSATIASATSVDNFAAEFSVSDAIRQNYYYNGKMYQQKGSYFQSISTTPSADNASYFTNRSTSIIQPDAFGTVNGNTAVFVNATGIILAGVAGQIWTSF